MRALVASRVGDQRWWKVRERQTTVHRVEDAPQTCKRYEDWVLEDPAGQGVEAVRPIRDEIRARILTLLGELGVEPVNA